MSRQDRTPVRILTFDRADFIATRVLIIAIALGSLMITLIWPVISWLRGEPLHWVVAVDVAAGMPDELTTTSNTVAQWNGEVLVTLSQASATTWLATLLPGLVLTTAVALAAVQLLGLLRDIQAREPFAVASVRRLRILALILIIAPMLSLVADAIASATVRSAAFVDAPFALLFTANGILIAIGAGLMVAALAEAFARGAELRADVDGLV
ncbi:MAG: DUF2975 domain-containing protein [Microlunatus sp.]